MKKIILIFLLSFIYFAGFGQENLQQNTNEATWDQGIPYFPESQTVTEMINKLDINEILNGKKLTINEVKLCREIGIAFYNRGMYDAAEWYLEKTKGYIDIVELDVEKDVHYICDELKKKEEKKEEEEEKISAEDAKSIQSDLNFVASLPKSFEKVSKQDLKKIANEIDDKINQLLAQKDSLLKAKAKQELIDAKDETINTLNKEKDIIDLTITNDDLKVETQELTVEKNSLRKYLMWVSAGLVLLILIILVLLQRKTIKIQDVEIENQLKDISKKNTYLEHAARIIRHDMHSGINTYIPRGITSLEKRLTPEDITKLKIDSSLKMIKEGLNHTQKVYKSVYEFTNLVKQNVVLDKKDVNLKTILDSYLLGTTFKNQVVVGELPNAKVNEILFCNAIDNLIRNGLKYNNSENKEVKIFMEENNLIVQDNGVGLSQKEFDKLRLAYTKRKDSEDYSGLGLSICLAILNEHGFELTCEKNEIGTKMKIKLI